MKYAALLFSQILIHGTFHFCNIKFHYLFSWFLWYTEWYPILQKPWHHIVHRWQERNTQSWRQSSSTCCMGLLQGNARTKISCPVVFSNFNFKDRSRREKANVDEFHISLYQCYVVMCSFEILRYRDNMKKVVP